VKAAELLGFGFALVVGWTDPEGARPWLGALLLAYYDPDGRLIYAGRAGTGIDHAELDRLWRRLQPLATSKMPLDVPPPRASRFGSRLVLSRVHRVRPELVAEVKYLTWTEDNLLRQVIYEGLREDKPAAKVRRAVPYPSPLNPRVRLPAPSGPGLADGGSAALPDGLFLPGCTITRAREPGTVRPRLDLPAGPSPAASGGPHHAPITLFSPFSPDLRPLQPPPAGLSLTMITPRAAGKALIVGASRQTGEIG
jgi:hypothetical protein